MKSRNVILLTSIMASSVAHAVSSLAIAEQIDLASSNAPASNANFNVSVNGNYQGYQGTGNDSGNNLVNTDATFNGSIAGYRFWKSSSGGGSETIDTLTESGSIISDITSVDAAFQNQSFARIWETTDPNGNAFSSTQDFSGNIGNLNEGATGTIDVSNMAEGSVYIFYGAYRSTPSLSINMTGSGTAADLEILELHNGDFANNNEFFVVRVDFVNEDAFTTIEWDFASGSNGRWSGIVVTEPATVVATPEATAFSYNPADGTSEIIIKGDPGVRYKLVEADDLDFSSPDQDPVPLTGATVGTLDGNEVVADGNGDATVQFSLSTTKAQTFIRAVSVP